MQQSVPQIPGHPFIGNLLQFRRDPLGFSHETAFDYGRVVIARLGPLDLYLVSHPDDIQRVLRDNNQNYVKEYTAYPLFAISGEGLVNMEGNAWLQRRRMMQPYFHRKRISQLTDLMQSAVEERIDMLDELARREEYVDVTQLMRILTAHVFTKAMYGLSMSDADTQALSDAMGTAINYVWQRYITFRFVPEWAPFPGKRNFHQAHHLLHETSRRLIQQRRQLGKGDDLLSMLIEMSESDEDSLTDDQLLKETVSLFQGGFDTSAGTLTWLFYLLTQHPDVEAKMVAEYEQILGDSSPSSATIQKLTYTLQVIQETMRLYPVAPSILRIAVEEDQLGDHTIPAGAMVNVSFVHVHRNPSFWQEPLAFKPERFANGTHQATSHRFAYVPFSSGPRMCIGDQFALTEMCLTVASIVQRYKVQLAPNYTLAASADSTYFPTSLPLRFERRA